MLSRLDAWIKALLGAEWKTRVDAGRRGLGARIAQIVEHPSFERVIVALIVLNAIILGADTSETFRERFGWLTSRLDALILGVFVIEIGMRMAAQRWAYFRSGWSWFDMIIVAIAFAPSVAGVSALRAFRIFRLFRLFAIIPKMRRVIGGFFAALPGMIGVMGVLALIFYVSAVITTSIFGQVDPATLGREVTPEQLETMRALYGDLGRSFFTLFQLMTLEDWVGGVVAPTLEDFPNALLFFIPYIVVTSFAVLNLFIGIIVDSLQDEREHEDDERRAEEAEALAAGPSDAATDPVLAELRAIRTELAALREAQRGASAATE